MRPTLITMSSLDVIIPFFNTIQINRGSMMTVEVRESFGTNLRCDKDTDSNFLTVHCGVQPEKKTAS